MTCLMTPYIGKWALFEISSAVREEKKPFLLQLEASFGRQARHHRHHHHRRCCSCSLNEDLFFLYCKTEREELLTLSPSLMSDSSSLEMNSNITVGKYF